MKLFLFLSVYIGVGQKGAGFLEVADKRIVNLCKSGKREGYNLLIEKYQKPIYSICFRYAVFHEDALDIMQEVYIKLFNSVNRFDEEKPLSPYIKKVTVNTCLNFLRDRNKRTAILKPEQDRKAIEEIASSNESVEDEVSFKYTREVLEDAIRSLPGEMKMAVILRHVENMSYDDIARTMDCPVGTVKTYLFRGRKMLKDKLLKMGVWGCSYEL